MKPINQALRELLDAAGWTETELAARTSVTQGTINKYLHKRRGRQINSRSAETIRQIAMAFGLEPEYFLEYRMWRVQEIMRRDPQLVDDVYDFLIGVAKLRGILDEGPENPE